MARLVNHLKWRAKILVYSETTDEDDRPIAKWLEGRILAYEDIGVTANDKYLSMQAKTDVVRKIRCRLDKSVSQKNNRVQIKDTDYLITRIYLDQQNKMMELSLNYVD